MPFKLKSLLPANHPGPRPQLLTFDSTTTFLLDPCWDGFAPLNYLDELPSTIDAIILSHPTPNFLGAYAQLFLKRNLSIPVYATLPVSNLGRISTIELYRARGLIGDFDSACFEIDDIEKAFDHVTVLKLAQSVRMGDVVLTPYNAGHSLGGSIWEFKNGDESCVYAPSWNHTKDALLHGADFSRIKPGCMITGVATGSKRAPQKFLEFVDATLANGGTVVLPVKMSGRFLELFYLVDKHLEGRPFSVLVCAYSKGRVLTYAGGMLEWMDSSLGDEGRGIWDVSRVRCITPDEIVEGPKVLFVATEDHTVERGSETGGLMEEVLKRTGTDQRSTVLLTTRDTYLYKKWEEKVLERGPLEEGVPVPFASVIHTSLSREVALDGRALQEYKDRVAARKAENEPEPVEEEEEEEEEEESSESESESEDEDLALPVDMVPNKKLKMFPWRPLFAKADDYGVPVKQASFAKIAVSFTKTMNSAGEVVSTATKKNAGDDLSYLQPLASPARLVTYDANIEVRCGLVFVDLEGLVDTRSWGLMLRQLRCKKVLLLGEPSEQLAKQNKNLKWEVVGDDEIEVDIGVRTLDVLLGEGVEGKLKWYELAGGAGRVACVVGKLEPDLDGAETLQAETQPKIEVESQAEAEPKAEVEAQASTEPKSEAMEIDPAVPEAALPARKKQRKYTLVPTANKLQQPTLTIGTISLPLLRQRLQQKRYRVEFKGQGTLLVDSQVAVRKVGKGDVTVDGKPGRVFEDVRDEVRGMLAYV